MATEAHAARLRDPVAHTHALAGFLAGATIGFLATLEAAAMIGAVVGAVALEVGTAGLATPLVIGVVATVAEVGLTVWAGSALTGAAEKEGEELGSESLGGTSGAVTSASPDVYINGIPAARATDAESCHGGKIAQGSQTVGINGLSAARVGDKTTCGAVISHGSADVLIGGPTGTYLGIQSEVPSWVRWAVIVATIAVSLGSAAREIGPMIAEINETGLARAMQTGAKALKTSLEEKGGGIGNPIAAPGGAVAGDEAAAAAAKLRSAKTPAEIEDARNSLKNLDYESRKNVLNDYALNMDVSSAPNTATLYSGGRLMPTGAPGQTEWAPARSWAESASAKGRTTLEQTAGGSSLDKIDVFRPGDPLLSRGDGTDVWATASGRYADGATGDVVSYIDNPRAESIYNTVERPSIQDGLNTGRVTSLKEYNIDDFHNWMTH